MKFKSNIHAEPISVKDGLGVPREWVQVHTYDESEMALVEVHGSNMDSLSNTVEMWLRVEEVVALRDALSQILE